MVYKMANYIIVAAIDFGTTYSGCAFSIRDDFVKDPTKIYTKHWTDPVGTMTSEKTPTSILFKPDETFHSFGFEAEEKYMNLADDDEYEDWFYFSRYKMMLYNQLIIYDTKELESEGGKRMLAVKVFSESIRYLKEEAQDMCTKQIHGFVDSDFKWVLTVPAIWTDAAKGFMRKAAEMAGIPPNALTLCLEPEAAAIYIKHIPIEKKEEGRLGDSFQIFTPGSKYLICDAGGGTVDITAHEIKDDGSMREIFSANGGNWGGTKVDEAFKYVLTELFGDHEISRFRNENKYDMLAITRSFEIKKRVIGPEKDSYIVIRIPPPLKEAFTEMSKRRNIKNGKGSLEQTQIDHQYRNFTESGMTLERALEDENLYVTTIKRDKLQLSATLCQLLFKESIDAIRNHLLEILKRDGMEHVDTILLVGGYSESSMLQHSIKNTFPHKRLKIPNDASLSVLKGAVIYGHNPGFIKERVCKYTYGVACSRLFVDGVHREDYKFVNEMGEKRCNNILSIHARKDESIIVGQVQSRWTYGFDQTYKDDKYGCCVYISTESDPTYTTDDSCTKIGCVTLEIPKEKIDIYEDGLQISLTFSGTELEVEAVFKKTKEKVKSYFAFE